MESTLLGNAVVDLLVALGTPEDGRTGKQAVAGQAIQRAGDVPVSSRDRSRRYLRPTTRAAQDQENWGQQSENSKGAEEGNSPGLREEGAEIDQAQFLKHPMFTRMGSHALPSNRLANRRIPTRCDHDETLTPVTQHRHSDSKFTELSRRTGAEAL